ncbi:hypothetical protein ACCC92_27575, partial [Mucilaginibacter sp. Mucisp84]|uniref:hypothetical protein n=1 Tax=Mucilaginibacter sp. Mucisp84 TaxID=3243058 RepID=UPI0039A4EA44
PQFFCLIPSQQIGFFARKALPCKPGRTTGCNYFALTSPAPLLQKLAMPFPALLATIVLPAFARSLPADRSGFKYVTGI